MTDYNFDRVIVFGGTTEGREIADFLAIKDRLLCVCVATEYGENFLEDINRVRVGRLDMLQMVNLFWELSPTLVIDATHPYATDVTKNIKDACDKTGLSCIRIKRESEITEGEDLYLFNSLKDMIVWANDNDGTIFSTLGVKEAAELTKISNYKNRVWIRVLPTPSSLNMCEEAGFDREHVIDAMGPFSYEENVQMFIDTASDILLTKESGKAGGFIEKINAARDCKMKIAVLVRPKEENKKAFLVEEILEYIGKME